MNEIQKFSFSGYILSKILLRIFISSAALFEMSSNVIQNLRKIIS